MRVTLHFSSPNVSHQKPLRGTMVCIGSLYSYSLAFNFLQTNFLSTLLLHCSIFKKLEELRGCREEGAEYLLPLSLKFSAKTEFYHISQLITTFEHKQYSKFLPIG